MFILLWESRLMASPGSSRLNVHAMRLGPGKHLKGLTLMDGSVKPEEVRYVPEPLEG
jgi:hypothetical protein